MPRQDVKLQFHTDADVADRVKAIADRFGVSVSSVLAMLVRATLNGDAAAFMTMANGQAREAVHGEHHEHERRGAGSPGSRLA